MAGPAPTSKELQPLIDKLHLPYMTDKVPPPPMLKQVVLSSKELNAITAEKKKKDAIERAERERIDTLHSKEGMMLLLNSKDVLFEDLALILRKSAERGDKHHNIPASSGVVMKWREYVLKTSTGFHAEAKEWGQFFAWAKEKRVSAFVLGIIFHSFFKRFITECVPDKSIKFEINSGEYIFRW